MAKDYEDKMEDVVSAETDMEHLAGVIKSEMDDAKDFIHQVGAERAESTEYYLGEQPQAQSRMPSSA